jgi:hypothetical protein
MRLQRIQRLNQLRRRLTEEDGANSLLVLLILSAALFIIPVLVDFSIVHYTRRVAQTGSDAAVMSAAKDYASALSIEWWGTCNEPPISVVGRYWGQHVLPVGWSPLGMSSASSYAAANRSRLTGYANYFINDFKMVDGVPIRYVAVDGATEKEVNNLIDYGRDFDAPAQATSVAYLDRYDRWTVPCGWSGVLFVYRLDWNITLEN